MHTEIYCRIEESQSLDWHIQVAQEKEHNSMSPVTVVVCVMPLPLEKKDFPFMNRLHF